MNPSTTGKGVVDVIWRQQETARALAAIRRFTIKADDPEQSVATLSGGNQQKVVVARWMEAHVRLLILEEPTIGVDVASKAEIYHLLQLSLKRGMAVLLISSDFEEVERICHRALVFGRGRVAGEIVADQLSVAGLTACAAGGTALVHTPNAFGQG
jgi:ribose transport system ATP-binding protein